MSDSMMLLLFFIAIIFLFWLIISCIFKIPFLSKGDNGTHKQFEEKRAKLLAKLDETLKAIDEEKKYYYNRNWDIVETWKRHARRDIPSYGINEILDDAVYEALIETLDVGLADIRAGKNPYDSEHLLYEFAPKPEETEGDEEK